MMVKNKKINKLKVRRCLIIIALLILLLIIVICIKTSKNN